MGREPSVEDLYAGVQVDVFGRTVTLLFASATTISFLENHVEPSYHRFQPPPLPVVSPSKKSIQSNFSDEIHSISDVQFADFFDHDREV